MDSNSNSFILGLTDIFKNLFSSIDSSIYSALDEISFISKEIMYSSYLERIFGTSSVSGILLVANSLLVGFILYFGIRFLFSNFSIPNSENPYKFFIKIVLISICMNSSFFICEQIINIHSLISSAIRNVGSNFLNTNICFSNLINVLNTLVSIEENTQSIFSIDGIIKTLVSIGFVNLIFIYSIRYILIKVFILLSPFAILCASNQSTLTLFKSWLKCFISLLFIELFSSLILIVMFSIEYSPQNIVSKLLFVGSIFSLMKVNNFVRDFLGGITIDVQNSMYALRGSIRS